MTDRERLAADLARIAGDEWLDYEDDPDAEWHEFTADRLIALGWTREDEDALDNAYRERNAVVAALVRTNGWPASLMAAPDAEGWWVVYAETPQGQVSWHIHPTDVRLFDDVPRRGADWDGHSTDEKYERVAALTPVPLDVERLARAIDGYQLPPEANRPMSYVEARRYVAAAIAKAYREDTKR